jgi:DNA-binding transcriptional ArsR family regulator
MEILGYKFCLAQNDHLSQSVRMEAQTLIRIRKPRTPPEPDAQDLSLPKVFQALSDPVRIGIVRAISLAAEGKPCGHCACPKIPKSTLAHHFKVLREAGIVRSRQHGTQLNNTLRLEDLEMRFPGLMQVVLAS